MADSFHSKVIQANGNLLHSTLLKPSNGGPLLIMHHGMGSSAATFTLLVEELRVLMKNDGIGFLTFDCRFHGLSCSQDPSQIHSFDMEELVKDCDELIHTVLEDDFKDEKPPIILLGHSMGGTVVSRLSAERKVPNIQGLVVLDAVEGYAVQALRGMPSLVSMWPTEFNDPSEAVAWTVKHNQVRNEESARLSVPPLLRFSEESGKYHWRVDLLATKPYWDTWFAGLDSDFLHSGTANLLILAGTGRLDKELMIGQMQGKYQLVVFNDSGHFIQEDHPHKTAITIEEFWTRNQRPMVIPTFGKFRES